MFRNYLLSMVFLLLSATVLAEPTAKLMPTSLDFKEQAVNVMSTERTMTLTNAGQEELTNVSITLGGTHKGDFIATSTCGTTLIVGQGCDVKVTFKPKAEGAREATLTVKSNAEPIVATLKGSGIVTTPVPSVTPTAVDFGSHSVGSSDVTKTVTLKNSGNGELNKVSFTIETAKTGEFAVSAPDCMVLAAGKSCKVNLAFKPTTAGERVGTLTIKSNATPPLQVALKGIGVVETPQIKISPTAIEFPTQATATTSTEKVLTISNSGKVDLKNISVALTGSHKADFKIASNTCQAVLTAESSCKVGLTFTPKAEGVREAVLTVKSNATETPSQIALKGTGQVEKPAIKLSPTSLSFTTQVAATTSAEKMVTISNSGKVELKNISVTLTGTHKAEFKVASNTCQTTLAPSGTCTVAITFTPKTEGVREAVLAVKSNATTTPSQVALKGTGKVEKPEIKLSPTSLNFATQATKTTSAEKVVTISNSGKVDLKNLSVAVTGTHKAEFKVASNTCESTLAPSGTCIVAITFTPKAEGDREAILTVKSNATETPSQVALKGAGKGDSAVDNPYPALGKAFVLETDGQILPAKTKFAGGIAVKGGKLAKVNKFKWIADVTTGQFSSELVDLSGLITPETEEIGQAAEIFVVEFLVPADAEGKATGSYEDCGNPEKGTFYMWTAKEPLTLEPWDGEPATLVAFSQISALKSSTPIEVYQGSLPNAGHHCLYFGYQTSSGRLFFNGENTINFMVSQ